MRYIPFIAMLFAAAACQQGKDKAGTANNNAYTLTEGYHLDADSVLHFAARKDLPEDEADNALQIAV